MENVCNQRVRKTPAARFFISSMSSVSWTVDFRSPNYRPTVRADADVCFVSRFLNQQHLKPQEFRYQNSENVSSDILHINRTNCIISCERYEPHSAFIKSKFFTRHVYGSFAAHTVCQDVFWDEDK